MFKQTSYIAHQYKMTSSFFFLYDIKTDFCETVGQQMTRFLQSDSKGRHSLNTVEYSLFSNFCGVNFQIDSWLYKEWENVEYYSIVWII